MCFLIAFFILFLLPSSSVYFQIVFYFQLQTLARFSPPPSAISFFGFSLPLCVWESSCMPMHRQAPLVSSFPRCRRQSTLNPVCRRFALQCRRQGWPVWPARAPPPPPASPPWTAAAAATTSTAYWRPAPPGGWTTRPRPKPWRSPAKPHPFPTPHGLPLSHTHTHSS